MVKETTMDTVVMGGSRFLFGSAERPLVVVLSLQATYTGSRTRSPVARLASRARSLPNILDMVLMPSFSTQQPPDVGRSSVLVLADLPAHRAPLVALLDGQGLEALVAEHMADALRLVRARRADLLVAVVPAEVRQAQGFLVAMKESDPALEVLVLAAFERPDDERWLLRHGLAFDVLRPPPHDLPALTLSIDLALRRRARLLAALRDRHAPEPEALAAARGVLTPRETATLRLVADGLENREIARLLVVSENTVRNNLARVYGKLGADNRTQAVNIARRLNVL